MDTVDSIIDGLRNARKGVEEATGRLVNGARILGAAVLHDTETLLAKFPAHYFDYNKAATQASVDRQVDEWVLALESKGFKPSYASGFGNTAKWIFNTGIGLDPKETVILATAMLGVGMYGGAVNNFADSQLINNMTSVLDMYGSVPLIGNEAAVIGALAITTCAAVKVFISMRGMVSDAGFEESRRKEKEVIDVMESCAALGGYSNSNQLKELDGKRQAFSKDFDEDKHLSKSTVDDITRMSLAGAGELAIEARIQNSPAEAKLVKQINILLANNYAMSSAKAASVTHDLLIKTSGDVPLITSKLISRAVPKAWVEDVGFDERYVVGENKTKDRASELLKIAGEAVQPASEFFKATAEKIKNHFEQGADDAVQAESQASAKRNKSGLGN